MNILCLYTDFVMLVKHFKVKIRISLLKELTFLIISGMRCSFYFKTLLLVKVVVKITIILFLGPSRMIALL